MKMNSLGRKLKAQFESSLVTYHFSFIKFKKSQRNFYIKSNFQADDKLILPSDAPLEVIHKYRDQIFKLACGRNKEKPSKSVSFSTSLTHSVSFSLNNELFIV